MTVFCTETSSLGFKSCMTLSTSDSVSQNMLVDHGAVNKSTNRAVLITPDLWLVDGKFNQLTTENHHNTIESNAIETEANEPLNLVLNLPSSPHNTDAIKRKSTNTDVNKKKGKSHRKPQPRFDQNYQKLPRSGPVSPVSLPLASSYPNEWRGFSSQFEHQSLYLQSQLLSNINGLMEPPLQLDETSNSIHPDVSMCEETINGLVNENCPKSSAVENCIQPLPQEQNTDKVCNIIPPNMIIFRVPCLVPILIPVPIPIPLNIHEKYLREILN